MEKFPGRIVLLLLCLVLSGCAKAETAQPATEPTQAAAHTQPVTEPVMEVVTAPVTEPATEPSTMNVEAEAEAMEEAPPPPVAVVLEAEAPGELEERCDVAVIDYSNTQDGYVMVRYLVPSESRLKVLVNGPDTKYSYNLPVDEWTVFPLSDRNGTYQIGVYQNISGTKYAKVLAAETEVNMTDEFAPFLRPNQYVNYTEATLAVSKGLEITADYEAPLDKVAAVYDYVVSNLSYDHDRAATVKSGYIPDLDQVLEEKKGICFDYAALMTAMLRSQQIPCKMVFGYAGSVYHAWISVWTEDSGWVDGVIFFDGVAWKRLDPTFASTENQSDSIMNYINNNSNYQEKYFY